VDLDIAHQEREAHKQALRACADDQCGTRQIPRQPAERGLNHGEWLNTYEGCGLETVNGPCESARNDQSLGQGAGTVHAD
jgi:hypothetical protein